MNFVPFSNSAKAVLGRVAKAGSIPQTRSAQTSASFSMTVT
jgi:hypothetical protein